MVKRKSHLFLESLEARAVPTRADWTFGRAGRGPHPLPDGSGTVIQTTTDNQGHIYLLLILANTTEVIRLDATGKRDDSFGDHGIVRLESQVPGQIPVEPNGGPGSASPLILPPFYPSDLAIDGEGRVVIVNSNDACSRLPVRQFASFGHSTQGRRLSGHLIRRRWDCDRRIRDYDRRRDRSGWVDRRLRMGTGRAPGRTGGRAWVVAGHAADRRGRLPADRRREPRYDLRFGRHRDVPIYPEHGHFVLRHGKRCRGGWPRPDLRGWWV